MKTWSIGNGQLQSAMTPIEETSRTIDCMHDAQAILRGGEEMDTKTVVRRLTPIECERLQGFPDGWTDLGEWTDSKGKIHKETSDGARYKALGNSIALPYWYWLLKRISAQYERTPTLGSLFDGIGGFPYCWARINGLKSCIWASEIEEFPIAVTERHFGENGDFYEVLERHEKNEEYKSWDKPKEDNPRPSTEDKADEG